VRERWIDCFLFSSPSKVCTCFSYMSVASHTSRRRYTSVQRL